MKKVIYSALVGGYDNIKQPKIVAEGFDYILFTDNIPDGSCIGIWKTRPIPYRNKDNTKTSRWVKTHPNELLSEYDYSLYIDSNVVVDDNRFFEIINVLIERNILLAGMDHDKRWCLYEEALEVIYQKYDKVSRICREILMIKHSGFPRHNGLNENNCILRSHHSSDVHKMNLEWWYMIEKYSKRDQLSYRYVVWKNSLKVELILPERCNSRNHPFLHCEKHKTDNSLENIIWFDIRDMYFEKASAIYKKMLDAQNNSLNETIYLLRLILLEKIYSLIAFKYKVSIVLKRKFCKAIR